MAIKFIVKQTPAPPEPEWYTYRDQTYWKPWSAPPDFATWTDPLTHTGSFGNGWQDFQDGLSRYLILEINYAPWLSGFEPEKIRVTFGYVTELDTQILLSMTDDPSNPWGDPIVQGYASYLTDDTQQITLDIDWDVSVQSRPSYPKFIRAERHNGQAFNIHNIEFYH